MPRIIVTLDPLSSDPTDETPVLLDEQVQSVHLSTGHAAAQLVERLAWAVGDAESAEVARSEPHRARHERPARARRPVSRSSARRAVSA
jgi:hypothetical protein